MNRSLRFFLLLAALGPAAQAPAVQAQPLAVGEALPGGTFALSDADGQSLSLPAQVGENGLVVVFWSNVCPWAERYTGRLADLAREYGPAGVGFVAVNANDSTRFPDENLEGMRAAAERGGFAFPYVVDEGGRLAAAFGAENAPTAYFFDAARVLRYVGALDSSPADPARVEEAYLRDALDLVIAGQEVAVQRTNALGCSIRGGR